MREITHHRTSVPTDANAGVRIAAGEPGPGGAPQVYTLQVADGIGLPYGIAFASVGQPGLTNETLLAVVCDRLEQFQKGPCPCVENADALRHATAALNHLKLRTARRAAAGLEGKMAEDATKPRVRIEVADGVDRFLWVTGTQIAVNKNVDRLRTSWAAWSDLEAVLRSFDPPVTPAEWAVLEGVAAGSPTAKSGLAELKSALANTAAVRT